MQLTQPVRPPALRRAAEGEIEDIYVINDDITLEKPIDEYYEDLDTRLHSLRTQLGDEAEYLPSTYEKYVRAAHGGPGTLQRNVREYYNELKLLRNDTQVRVGREGGCAGRRRGQRLAGRRRVQRLGICRPTKW